MMLVIVVMVQYGTTVAEGDGGNFMGEMVKGSLVRKLPNYERWSWLAFSP